MNDLQLLSKREKEKQKAHAKYVRNHDLEVKNSVKYCDWCLTRFWPTHLGTLVCCDSCRKSRQNAINRERNNNREFKDKRNALLRERVKNDPIFRARCLIGKQLWRALKRTKNVKSDQTLKFLPYTIPQLKAHLESFFDNKNGFTWENHGKLWQIDHIIPQSMFPYESFDTKMFRDCWALSNLRPMLSKLNTKKSNNWVGFEGENGQLEIIP